MYLISNSSCCQTLLYLSGTLCYIRSARSGRKLPWSAGTGFLRRLKTYLVRKTGGILHLKSLMQWSICIVRLKSSHQAEQYYGRTWTERISLDTNINRLWQSLCHTRCQSDVAGKISFKVSLYGTRTEQRRKAKHQKWHFFVRVYAKEGFSHSVVKDFSLRAIYRSCFSADPRERPEIITITVMQLK